MRSLPVKCWLSALLAVAGLSFFSTAQAATPARPATSTGASASNQFVDGIAAVVNKQVITLRQVNTEADIVREQMKRQKIPVPPTEVLQRQVLQRLINLELERQEAERLGIRVSDAQVTEAVKSIAQRNNVSEARLRQEVERSGVTWPVYLANIKLDIRRDLIRQRVVDPRINITDAEVESFLRSQAARGSAPQFAPQQAGAQTPQAAIPAGPAVLGLAQILVVVPETATPSQVRDLRAKAESLLARVKSGADFAGVAAASSDGPEALEGGSMGVRPEEGWPDLFLDATRSLKAGEVTGIVQSGNGFHILKVVTRGQPAQASQRQQPPAPASAPASPAPQVGAQSGPMMVTQTRARHILVKTSQVMTSDKARTRLEQVRQRLLNGEPFEDLAKRYSEDSTAPLGGDLGWLSPGETVPPFQRAMDALQPGQISEPVESQFGWHLIEVTDRRTQDMADEYRRVQARQALFERRVEPAFDDWLNRIRGQAYIDNRLDPAASNRAVRR
ncbi:MAG: molecular chaperone SurA [Alcaligenaceae bacterium]|nr:molecular chaperone SurA [Alcaligenaceae bacterium]